MLSNCRPLSRLMELGVLMISKDSDFSFGRVWYIFYDLCLVLPQKVCEPILLKGMYIELIPHLHTTLLTPKTL